MNQKMNFIIIIHQFNHKFTDNDEQNLIIFFIIAIQLHTDI